MAEVELGKLAQQKAASDQVKQFGKKMADDHQKANEQLKTLASKKGMTLPADMTSSDRREYDKLQKKSGADFDREYMKEMVSDHKKDVKDFESAAKKADDADIKSFASTTLPTLQQHLDLAQQTENVAKSEGNQKTSSAR
jgi:putative membrane protein